MANMGFRGMFISISRKKLIAFIIAFLVLVSGFFAAYELKKPAAAPKLDYTVVIDAGHGGIDGGVVGKNTKAVEAELNLKVAKKLNKKLTERGFKTVMTRTNEKGLYGNATKNFKRADMKERKRIIEEAKPDIVVSIHMNYFGQTKQRGAQVFYKQGNPEGAKLARCIQDGLKNLEYCDRTPLPGDYFMVTSHEYPAVIIECGFLSNPQEEALLITDEYQEKLAYYIMMGIMKYLDFAPYEAVENAKLFP